METIRARDLKTSRNLGGAELSILQRYAAFPRPRKEDPNRQTSPAHFNVRQLERWFDGIERLRAELAESK